MNLSLKNFVLHVFSFFLVAMQVSLAQSQPPFAWPDGKQVAISLTFDDARESQVEVGTALLDQFGVKGTFYVVPSAVERKLEGWKKALENYSVEQMRDELIEANEQIQNLLGVQCKVFAYPCGQTFVGRGKETKSYVPVIADIFFTGRGWLDEGPNDPQFCDFAQLTGIESDGKDFDQVLPLIESAKKNKQWLVLAGHEMNETGTQTTRLSMLKKLLEYARDPSHGVWIAPVGTVAKYVKDHRKF